MSISSINLNQPDLKGILIQLALYARRGDKSFTSIMQQFGIGMMGRRPTCSQWKRFQATTKSVSWLNGLRIRCRAYINNSASDSSGDEGDFGNSWLKRSFIFLVFGVVR